MDAKQTKRPAIMVDVQIGETDGTLTFDVDGVGKLKLRPADLSIDIQRRATYHGLEQKVRDAAAIGYTQKDGTVRRPSNREKFDAMRDVIETLQSGEWNRRKEGVSDGGLLFEALCRLYVGKKTPDDIRAWLDGKDEKTKASLRRNSKVAEMIATVRAERNPDAATAAEDVLAELAE